MVTPAVARSSARLWHSGLRLGVECRFTAVRHLNNLGNSCNELVYIIFYVEKVLCLFPPLAQNSAGIPCVSMLVKFCLIQFRFAVIIAKMIRSFTSLFSFGIEFCSLTCHKDVI